MFVRLDPRSLTSSQAPRRPRRCAARLELDRLQPQESSTCRSTVSRVRVASRSGRMSDMSLKPLSLTKSRHPISYLLSTSCLSPSVRPPLSRRPRRSCSPSRACGPCAHTSVLCSQMVTWASIWSRARAVLSTRRQYPAHPRLRKALRSGHSPRSPTLENALKSSSGAETCSECSWRRRTPLSRRRLNLAALSQRLKRKSRPSWRSSRAITKGH